MKVIIVGAGIGGLSTAHYLAKYSNYEIHVYEQSEHVGGLVKSDRTKLGMPTQHSPRVILPNYDLLTEIMEEVNFDKHHTVKDKLVQTHSITISDHKVEQVSFMKNKLNLTEKIYLGYTLLDGLLSCNERSELLDHLKVTDIITSKEGLKWARLLSYVAGESLEVMPVYKFLRFLEVEMKNLLNENKTKQSFALTGPYSEYFLEQWKEHLEEQGVVFHLNTKVHRIESKNNEQIVLSVQEAYKSIIKITTDNLVLALDIESLNNFLKHSNLDTYYSLADKTFSEQLGLQLGFGKKIRLPYKKPAFYALDTDWQLIIEPQEVNFEDEVYLGDGIEALWSITIPDVHLKSKKLKKTVKESSPEEIVQEVIHQIKDALHVNPDLVHSSVEEHIHPYTWNSKSTLHMRPKTKIANNVYLASSIVRNPYYFTYKEGACEAALLAVESMLGKTLIERNRRVNKLKPLHKIDSILYNLCLPSFLNTFMLMILFYIISLIIRRIRK